MSPEQSALYQQATLLAQQAHQLESQIDEVRRADIKDRAVEIQKLNKQFSRIQADQDSLNKKMDALRETLKQDPALP